MGSVCGALAVFCVRHTPSLLAGSPPDRPSRTRPPLPPRLARPPCLGRSQVTGEGATRDYFIESNLGHGSFGEVFRARHRHQPSRTVALKVRPRPRLRLGRQAPLVISSFGLDVSGLTCCQALSLPAVVTLPRRRPKPQVMARERIKVTSIQREFAVMEAMGSHPGIVGYHGCYKTPEKVTFVLELMNGGELFERLVHKGAYTEAEARPAFRRIARALAYLHSRGIVHRDLKVREPRSRLPSLFDKLLARSVRPPCPPPPPFRWRSLRICCSRRIPTRQRSKSPTSGCLSW